jgi:hypothetical protein
VAQKTVDEMANSFDGDVGCACFHGYRGIHVVPFLFIERYTNPTAVESVYIVRSSGIQMI